MDTSRFDNMTIENAINQIKQKHFRDLDATDYAFLKARADYLTEADKAIYLEGKDPKEVLVDSTPLTREERIINENRPLQEAEKAVFDAKNESARITAEALQPKVGDAKTEADEKLQEEREAKVKSLEAEVKVAEKAAVESDKEAKKVAAKTAKEGETK